MQYLEDLEGMGQAHILGKLPLNPRLGDGGVTGSALAPRDSVSLHVRMPFSLAEPSGLQRRWTFCGVDLLTNDVLA